MHLSVVWMSLSRGNREEKNIKTEKCDSKAIQLAKDSEAGVDPKTE